MTVRDARAGFTLMEIMVALVLLAVVITIVTMSFVSVANTTEVARKASEEMRLREYLLEEFTTALITVCAQPDYGFIGTDEEGPYGPADRLEFACLAPAQGANALPGVVKYVTYSVGDAADSEESGEADEDREEASLEITQEYLVQTNTFFGEEVEVDTSDAVEQAPPKTVPIRTLDITYYDDEKEEWVESWDSTALGFLPWAVKIKINLPRTRDELDGEYYAGIDPAEDPDIEMVIPLPAGEGVVSEFVDLNHFTGTIAEDKDR